MSFRVCSELGDISTDYPDLNMRPKPEEARVRRPRSLQKLWWLATNISDMAAHVHES